MKRYKLRGWVKQVIFWSVLIIAIILSADISNKLDRNFMTNCMEQGYSYDYCEMHK